MNAISTIGIMGFGIVFEIVGGILIQNPDNSLMINIGWGFIAGGLVLITGVVISTVKDVTR